MPDTQPPLDFKKAKRFELNTFIKKGMRFTTPKRSLLRHFGKPERSFLIQQSFLGRL